jgi:transcription elongation GreA/GreB family factor
VTLPATAAAQVREAPRVAEGPVPGSSPASGLGSTIEVQDLATGLRFVYRLVEPHEARPTEGSLSSASPVGIALRARHVGEVVTATTPRGHRRLRIMCVT